MSSRSRPITGIVLLEEVTESGKKKDGVTISAELVLDGGVAATATFDAAPGYELNRGMFYDVEVRSKNLTRTRTRTRTRTLALIRCAPRTRTAPSCRWPRY